MNLQPGQNVESATYAQVFTQGVNVIPSGGSIVLDVHGLSQISIITDASATVTVSRVDSATASSHNTGVNQFTVGPSVMQVTPTDWPFYYVTVSGGTARIAVV